MRLVSVCLGAAVWGVVLLPYAVCCLWPQRGRLRAQPLWRRMALPAFFAISLCAWLALYARGGGAPAFLAVMLATMVLGILLAWLCTGAPVRYVLYCAVLGVNASAALALTTLGGLASRTATWYLLVCGPAASALLALLCAISLKRLAAPFERQILGGRGIFDVSALLYPGLMLLFYFDGFALNNPGLKYPFYILCLLGAWTVYLRNARFLSAAMENAGYVQRNSMLEHSLQLQQAQYAALTAQVAQARAARHDLRHHQRVMEQYVRDGDRARLREYLESFSERLEACREEPAICLHPAADALARYYLERIEREGARLDVALDIREDIAIPAFDLCIVLGNCLENALEALRECPSEQRFLRMRAEQAGQTLTLVAGNSYCGERLRAGEEFLSTKRRGEPGIGLSSIRAVAQKYGGSVKAETAGGIFRISIILFGKED